MRPRSPVTFVVTFALWATVTPLAAEVTAQAVGATIQRGMTYLKSRQSKTRGNWPERPGQPCGLTALCALALLESGEPLDSPAIQNALAYLRAIGTPKATYSAALQTMVFCAAEPKKDLLLIRENAQWLRDTQLNDGAQPGGWSYFGRAGAYTREDNSNSQFALLGLHEAEQVGIEVDDGVWRRALAYWQNGQKHDGSWAYHMGQASEGSTGSMTAAGISALVISSGQLHAGDARVSGENVQCGCQQQDDLALQRGLQWLGSKFTVHANPGADFAQAGGFRDAGLFYYLYGVERVGRLTGQRFLGRHDWYREGADMLVARQQQGASGGFWKGNGHGEDDELIATSLALLFLAKGRRPVVMARLQHGQGTDWNLHRGSVRNLTHHVERLWKQRLTWQTIDIHAATLEDLLESPVLLLSGRESLQITPEQKENLRAYVNQGGFILAEACCDGDAFDQAFRVLMRELFPDSSLRLLPPEHPIWFAQQPIATEGIRPLYGIDACCRTSVVYCPKDLSCYWELDRGPRQTSYAASVQAEVDACMTIGANVLAYATNRQLKDKLDRPQIRRSSDAEQGLNRGMIVVPKLQHNGGADEARRALANMLNVARQQTGLRLSGNPELLSLENPQLFDYPLVFIHGRRGFQLSIRERRNLASYLERGGCIWGDAICGSPQFAEAFRREIQAALPNARFERLPADHPLFSTAYRGFRIDEVTLRDPQVKAASGPLTNKLQRVKPRLECVVMDGRLAVVFSPYDISCAMENHASLECRGYPREDAARLAVNVLLYVLQQ